MTESANGNTAAEIEVAFAGNVVKITAGAMTPDQVESAIARNDVLLKQRLNGRDIIADNGRRRRRDGFQVMHGKRKQRVTLARKPAEESAMSSWRLKQGPRTVHSYGS